MNRLLIATVATALLAGVAHAEDNVDCFVQNGERNYVGTETMAGCVPWSNLGPAYAGFFAPEMTYATMGSYCRGINNGAGGVFCFNGGGFSWCSGVPMCTSAAATTTTTTTTTSTTQAPTADPSASCGAYANLVDAGETHSKCLAAAPACTFLFGMYTLTSSDQTLMEDGHNAVRSRVALGTATGPVWPAGSTTDTTHGPAKNMRKMSWSNELQEIAQAWTNQCRDIEDLHYGGAVNKDGHDCDNCRRTLDGADAGQNSYWSATTSNYESIHTYLQDAMDNWEKEKDLTYNPDVFDAFYTTPGVVYGHYTAMIWADSDKLGCGMTRYRCSFKDSDGVVHEGNCVFIACNYQSVGNIDTKAVFESGAASCTTGTLESASGLCVV